MVGFAPTKWKAMFILNSKTKSNSEKDKTSNTYNKFTLITVFGQMYV